MMAGFITYCSMYAFRKPFTAATFDGLQLWGIDYKIVLITAQVIGYALSKFAGIKIVSEMQPRGRIKAILGLIGVSWLALLLFALTPPSFGFVWLFLNGLPLGMIWGLVFSFLEGRKNTELSGAAMSVSFIISSGLVKAVGKYLIENAGVSDFWMPFYTGFLFVPLLLVGVWMLSKIPPQAPDDIHLRTERVPMRKAERKRFFLMFAPGIVFVVFIYMALTIFRDIRDNFAVEIWARLGYEGNSQVLATAEIPIAIAIMIITGLMVLIKNNRVAFYINLMIVLFSGFLLMLTTYLFTNGLLSAPLWMILFGFATYLAYVTFHTMLFERWIALFRYRSNIGFLLYIADAFGYLGSVGILFYRNFRSNQTGWLDFIHQISYGTGVLIILLSLAAILYFLQKEKNMSRQKTSLVA
jgi:hypothetical protein